MKIHFVGIGGIGMSALARLYHESGHQISGSDFEDSELLNLLRKEGIRIQIGHASNQVPKNANCVIYSEAILNNNVELKKARQLKIPLKTYFAALGEFTANKKTICIAGTHGKTTTTALVAKILIDAKLDPSIVIGTQMQELDNKNMRSGKGEYMVVEACEYRRSFHYLKPQLIILTNIELDHVDYYKNIADYLSAFKEFIQKLPPTGFLIANYDDLNIRKIIKTTPVKVIRYSQKSSELIKIKLKVPGQHNLMNALAAFTLGKSLNLDEKIILKSLNNFTGTWRRFEYLGKFNKALIYTDYAHHPTEIQATLKAAREKYPKYRIIVVFQPHQYSRARYFLKQFSESFSLADEVIIPNIYKVRDSIEDSQAVTPEKMVKEIQK